MASSDVIRPKDINVNLLKFSEPKTLSNNGKAVYVSYNGDKLTIQTPIMRTPFGVNDWNDADAAQGNKKAPDAPKRYDMNLEFSNLDTDDKAKQMFDKFQEIETAVKTAAFKNRIAWLRDGYDDNKTVTDKLFTPIIKFDKDKDTGKVANKYPPSFKVKLPFDNAADDFSFDATDMTGNQLTFKDIMKNLRGGRVKLIIQVTGLWFAGGRYGVSWKVISGRFQVMNKSRYGFLPDSDDEAPVQKHIGGSDDDDLAADAAAAARNVSPIKKALLATTLSDSEDEAPPPPKKTAKTVAPPVPVPEPEEESEAEEDDEADAESEAEESSDESEPSPPPPPPKKITKKAAAAKKA
jgi:hypothetical protein